jgi:hypothetical protein
MKKITRPKDSLVEPEEQKLIDEGDVEGHGLPTTAPPNLAAVGPGHGGEYIPSDDDEDDVEGPQLR